MTSAAAENKCPECDTSNPQGRRYCAACGLELTDHCPECGLVTSILDSHCSHCDKNLDEHFARLESQIAAVAQAIEAELHEFRFEAALAMVAANEKKKHPRLRKAMAKLSLLAEQIPLRREQTIANIKTWNAQAKVLAEAGQEELAMAELRKIPANLMPGTASDLLSRLSERLSLQDRLRQEIQSQIESGTLDGVLPKIASYLEMESADSRFKNLGIKLAGRIFKTAHARFDAADYREAYRLSCQLVPPFVTKKCISLKNESRARLAMETAIAKIDRCDLLQSDLIRRMTKEAPDHPRLQTWKQQRDSAKPMLPPDARLRPVDQRDEEVQGIGGLIPWAWSHSHLISHGSVTGHNPAVPGAAPSAADAVDDRTKNEHRPVTYQPAAVGLALQALRDVTVAHDFSSAKKSLFRFTLSGKKRPLSAWGIHVAGQGITAVNLHRKTEDDKLSIERSYYLPLSRDQVANENFSQTLSVATQTLFKAIQDHPGSMVVGIPHRFLIPRFFNIPKTEEKKINSIVAEELERQCPIRLDNTLMRWHYFDALTLQGMQAVMATIAKQANVSEIEEVFSAAHLPIAGMQTGPQAIYNWVMAEFFLQDNFLVPTDGGLGVLEIGRHHSLYLAASKQRFWWKPIPVGSHDLTIALARELGVSWEQAELAVRRPATVKRFERFWDLLQSFQANLCTQVEMAIEGSSAFMSGISIKHMVCCGDGIKTVGTLESLRYGARWLSADIGGPPVFSNGPQAPHPTSIAPG